MSRAGKSQAAEDLWHLSISDLLGAPKERAPLAGHGPVIINLSTSTAPIGPPPKSLRRFDSLHLYQLRRGPENQPEYLLRLGLIATDIEADAILASVLEHYPGATKAVPEDDDRAAIAAKERAARQTKDASADAPAAPPVMPAKQAVKTAAKQSEARRPAPNGAPAEPVTAAKAPEPVRWDIDELLPDLAVTRPSRSTPPASAPAPKRARTPAVSSPPLAARAAPSPSRAEAAAPPAHAEQPAVPTPPPAHVTQPAVPTPPARATQPVVPTPPHARATQHEASTLSPPRGRQHSVPNAPRKRARDTGPASPPPTRTETTGAPSSPVRAEQATLSTAEPLVVSAPLQTSRAENKADAAPLRASPDATLHATFEAPATPASELVALAILEQATAEEAAQPIEFILEAPEPAAARARPAANGLDHYDSDAITHEVPLPTFEFDAPEIETPATSSIEVAAGRNDAPMIDVKLAHDTAPTIEVATTCEEPPTVEVEAAREEPATVDVKPAHAFAPTIEIETSHEEPPTIEVKAAHEERATVDVKPAHTFAPTIEIETSHEEPPTIEVKAAHEERPTVDVKLAHALAPTIEIETVYDEPLTIEVKAAPEEPPTIDVNLVQDVATVDATTAYEETITVEVQTTRLALPAVEAAIAHQDPPAIEVPAAEETTVEVRQPALVAIEEKVADVAVVPTVADVVERRAPVAQARVALELAPDPAAETLEHLVAKIDAMVESVDQHDKESEPVPAPTHAPHIESTQTLRTLTTLELADDEASPWFSIQLAFSEGQIDPEQVPDLDLFNEYRLYSVMGLHEDRTMHALRLGFFSSELAAEAVAGYLRGFFNDPCIKRVSIAERERFAAETLTARKDIGATGVHAVIELTSPKALPERQAPVTNKSASSARTSIWSRLVAPLKR